MVKTKKYSTVGQKPLIKPHREEFERGMFYFRVKPIDMEHLEEFALEMLTWALEDEDALKITQYYNLKRLHHSTVEAWMGRCPKLREAHDMVLQVIGARREVGAMKGKYDSAIVRSTQAMYETSWKKIEEWRANLKAQSLAAAGGIQIVEIERFPDSNLVPERKKNDE